MGLHIFIAAVLSLAAASVPFMLVIIVTFFRCKKTGETFPGIPCVPLQSDQTLRLANLPLHFPRKVLHATFGPQPPVRDQPTGRCLGSPPHNAQRASHLKSGA
jgi:hypothetical protein